MHQFVVVWMMNFDPIEECLHIIFVVDLSCKFEIIVEGMSEIVNFAVLSLIFFQIGSVNYFQSWYFGYCSLSNIRSAKLITNWIVFYVQISQSRKLRKLRKDV